MTVPKPATAALYLGLVFLAGAIAGAAGGYQWGRSAVMRPNRPGDMGKFMIERFRTELELRPEQVDQITPIITNTTARIRGLHRDSWKQVGALVEESNAQIRALLDDSQKERFDAMEERRRQRDRDRNRERERDKDRERPKGELQVEPLSGPRPLSCRTVPSVPAG